MIDWVLLDVEMVVDNGVIEKVDEEVGKEVDEEVDE